MGTHTRKSSASRTALSPAVLKAIERSAKAEFTRSAASQFHSVNQANLSEKELVRLFKCSGKSLKNKNQLLSVIHNDQLVHFNPQNKYLTHPEQLWLIEAVIGPQAFHKALSIEKGKIVNDSFIEDLFIDAPFVFYLSADEAYLLVSDDELTQLDFGPLTKISALDALQRFGLVVLERAKEKTAVRL